MSTIQNMTVIGAITYVWSLGKLDSGWAMVALLAVIGVSLGERKLGGKGSAVVVLLAATALLQLIERLAA